jgi:hypothetical protein
MRLCCDRSFQSAGESIEFGGAFSLPGVAQNDKNSFLSFFLTTCFSSGYRSMNIKLALGALAAALVLTACAKPEVTAPATSSESAPAAEAPAAPAADATSSSESASADSSSSSASS